MGFDTVVTQDWDAETDTWVMNLRITEGDYQRLSPAERDDLNNAIATIVMMLGQTRTS